MSTKDEEKLPFEGDEFEKAWKEWLQYRKERRLPKYVPTGLKKTFAKLLRESEGNEGTAIAMINQSMESNYQGIFPLKSQINGTAGIAGTPTNRKSAGAAQLLASLKSNLGANGGGK